jgi:hypothetical protein
MKPFPNTQQAPDSKTCGPNCLLNVYESVGIKTDLSSILKELNVSVKDPTYISQLARHLHSKKLTTVMLTSNPNSVVFSWKDKSQDEIIDLLKKWVVRNQKDVWITENLHLLFFLQEGGAIQILDLSTEIIDSYLDQGFTIISCVDESWLWEKRQIEDKQEYDDIKGKGRGHFVIVYGKEDSEYLISDPYPTTIAGRDGLYTIDKQKLLVSTLVWDRALVALKK